MKKRLLSWLMVLTLCLTLLPTAALADTSEGENGESGISTQAAGHAHCICGATHEKIGDHKIESTVTFDQVLNVDSDGNFTANGVEISKYYDNGLPAGNYYLEKSITIKKSIKVYSGTVNICLNGHSITLEDNGNYEQEVFYVATHGTEPAVLNLTDCGNTVGKVTHSNGCTGSGVTLGNSSSAKGEVFNLYGGEITGNTVDYGGAGVNVGSVAYNGVAEDGCTFNMYGGAITSNIVSANRSSGGGVSLGLYSKFDLYDGVIKNNSSTYYGGGVSVVHESEFVMSGGEISENSAIYGGGVSTSLGALNGLDPCSFTMTGGTITKNTASQGGGVYHGGETFKVSGNATITENTANGKTDNVYLRTNNGKSATITIDGELTGEIGVTASTPSVGLPIATGTKLTDEIAAKFTSDNDTYKIEPNTDGTQLVLVSSTPVPTEDHKHCICGKTHAAIGDHTSESETTFATKLWMDGDKLMKGDDLWMKSTVKRADGGADSSEGYALTAGTYYLGTDLELSGTAILIDGDVKLCLNGCIIDQAYKTGGLDYVIRVLGQNNAHLTLTDCVGGGKLTGGKYGGVDIFGSCRLDMFDGTITGNEYNGGVDIGQFGTFNMYGGKITGNNNSYGGGVYNGGTFNMYGGEIRDNTATTYGGGVYVDSYSTVFKVSGSAKITDNTVNGAANNVYLPSGKTFTLGSHFTKDTYIGVTTAKKPEGSKTVTIASSVGELNYENYVKVDDSEKYEVKRSNGNLVLAAKNGSGTTPAKHEHYLCGGSESCTCPTGHKENALTEFQPWAETNKLPDTAGNYYLTDNVTLSSTWNPVDGTVLCLNGYSIKAAGDITAICVSDITFTLCDCKGDKGAYGQITHTASKTGSGVYVRGNGVFHMYGGSITGNTENNGGGVYMAGGQFTMYGGSITKNTAEKDNRNNGGNGGGVYVNRGCTFDMNGNASVSDNTATNNGGGVYASVGTFEMNDTASVTGNTANQGNGGGVYVNDGGTFTMNGSASVKSNKTVNNDAYGGGVYVIGEKSTFEMNGTASITDNTAPNGGGGVYVNSGKFNMNGNASIKSNTASGVFVSAHAFFTVSGEPTVTGNRVKSTAGNAASNVFLAGNQKTITIGKNGLSGNASIGVTRGAGLVIANDVDEDYSGKFSSDNTQYKVGYDKTKKQLVLTNSSAVTHTHEWTFTKKNRQ